MKRKMPTNPIDQLRWYFNTLGELSQVPLPPDTWTLEDQEFEEKGYQPYPKQPRNQDDMDIDLKLQEGGSMTETETKKKPKFRRGGSRNKSTWYKNKKKMKTKSVWIIRQKKGKARSYRV